MVVFEMANATLNLSATFDSQGELIVGNFEMAISLLLMASAGLMLVSYFTTVIVFLCWTHRTTKNAHAILLSSNQTNSDLPSPGWAVGYWFIPIVMLFKPYQTVVTTYRISAFRKLANLSSRNMPSYFGCWWFCYLIGTILARLETRLNDGSVGTETAWMVCSITSAALLAAAGICGFLVVNRVSASQTKHYDELTGIPSNESN